MSRTESVKSRLETVIALARLLERVEQSAAQVGADQYRALVRQIGLALDEDLPEDALNAVLGAHPATAEIYENRHYAQSGLSRSSLDRSVASEMETSRLLARVAKKA
jgi:hypothetical protein